jgi:hypothetical protein
MEIVGNTQFGLWQIIKIPIFKSFFYKFHQLFFVLPRYQYNLNDKAHL